MRCHGDSVVACAVVAVFPFVVWVAAAYAAEPAGVVIQSVDKDSAAERAGLQAGDVLVAWERSPSPPANLAGARGDFCSIAEALDIKAEQPPRGAVSVTLLRGRDRRVVRIAMPQAWDLLLRPTLDPEALARYVAGEELVAKGDRAVGMGLWWELAYDLASAGKHEEAAWLLYARVDDIAAGAGDLSSALSALDAGLVEAHLARAPYLEARIWHRKGSRLAEQGDLRAAGDAYARAVDVYASEKSAPARLTPGIRTGGNARYPETPWPLSLAWSLNNLGNNATQRGDYLEAQLLHERALAIRERVAPESLDVSASLANLGIVALAKGDLAQAEQLARRSIAIDEALAPDTGEVGLDRMNLGNVLHDRGDLAAAEEEQRRALAVFERIGNTGLAGGAVYNQGLIAMKRLDLDRAETLYRRTMKLWGSEADLPMSGLAEVYLQRGDLDRAEEKGNAVLAAIEKTNPGSAEAIGRGEFLGRVALARMDFARAQALLERALADRKKMAPRSLALAQTLRDLGEVARKRGDPRAAEEHYRQALAIEDPLPGSASKAETLRALGEVVLGLGRRDEALRLFRRAAAALEAQQSRLGGSREARAGFAAGHGEIYRDLIDALVEAGRPAEAFHVLERSRARALLEMLAERDLLFASDVPPDLARERRQLDAEYERTQAELAGAGAKSTGEAEAVLARLRETRIKQGETTERIRRAAPRLAALQYPQPLDLASVRRSLDPGTLLLAYSVGAERSLLFAVTAEGRGTGIEVYALPLGARRVRSEVGAFREQLATGVGAERARDLYQALIAPAERLLARASRILVMPDGPLHGLPFAALARGGAKGQAEYLIESKPIHTVVSMTVYAELRKTRREPLAGVSKPTVAAFGDPRYPSPARPGPTAIAMRGAASDDAPQAVEEEVCIDPDAVSDAQVRSAVERGTKFEPLPASRLEVEALASLYAPYALVYLGEEATEERAKSLGKEPKIVHFACHALLNDRFPLDSALALTIPQRPGEGQENGLLQAWEIFESVRLDADLVTLSACESGMGKEMGGEGLVGLARAFQYAGARSVLASLWPVQDDASAALMVRFYGYLRTGRTKDEALRQAQVDAIHDAARGATARPLDWAAWKLIGDWK